MPTAEELRKMLKEAENAERDADELNREAQSAAWKVITENPDNYEWQVKEVSCLSFDNAIIGLSVSCRIKPLLIKEWSKGGYSTFSSDYQQIDRWFGMFYFRTDEGILTHEGGGHCVLKTPKLCSDIEWEKMRKGNIPLKFRK